MGIAPGGPLPSRTREIPSWLWPLSAGALVLLTIYLLHPRREMPLEDDWAYALTIDRLVQTGRDQLHPWLSANMPFQALWGAMFAILLGPGFASLRISTVVLSLAGLYAFYRLLRGAALSPTGASVGVLLLWASPLYLRFTLNFMTDVPFTALILISLWLYSEAWARSSYRVMALAAAAGTAAILTRQFGIALIPGLALTASLRRYAPRTRGLLAIAVLPLLLAGLYQVLAGVLAPTWAQDVNLRAQRALVSNWRLQTYELLWRPGVILQYLCLFTLPLALAVAVRQLVRLPAVLRSRRLVIICLAVAITLAVSAAVGFAAHKALALPLIPWNLEELGDLGRPFRLTLTAIVMVLAVPFISTGIAAIRTDLLAAKADVAATLFHATMLSLLPLTLIYQQFGDEYLLVYVPWVIWTIARCPLRSRFAALSLAVMALLQLAIVTLWLDDVLSRNQVQWQAARNAVERLHIPPVDISAGWTWAAYYAFDDYLASHPSSAQTDFNSLFHEWLSTYDARARYRVKVTDAAITAPPGDPTLARRRTLSGRILQARAEPAP